MSDQLEQRSSQPNPNARRVPGLDRIEPPPPLPDPSATALFDLYEEVVEHRFGVRDAEIFEKIHQWGFSDFTLPAHEFADISKTELDAWQKRNRINLSAGRIRPEHIDLHRGYAWGHIRMATAVNRLHTTIGPPSAEEIKLDWSKTD